MMLCQYDPSYGKHGDRRLRLDDEVLQAATLQWGDWQVEAHERLRQRLPGHSDIFGGCPPCGITYREHLNDGEAVLAGGAIPVALISEAWCVPAVWTSLHFALPVQFCSICCVPSTLPTPLVLQAPRYQSSAWQSWAMPASSPSDMPT